MVLALLPLLALAVEALPTISRWVFGSEAEPIAQQVIEQASAVLGTTDAAEARRMLDADPALAMRLREALAKIQADQEAAYNATVLEAHKAQIADLLNARGTMLELVKSQSVMSWMPAILTWVAILLFALIAFVVLFVLTDIPVVIRDLVMLVTGVVIAKFNQSYDYWLGTSRGATEMRQELQRTAQKP